MQSEQDQQVFEELMDMCRNNAMASGNACNPIIFEPMVLSILLAQQERIWKIENKLNEMHWQESISQTTR